MPGKKLTAKDLASFKAQLEQMLGVLSGDIDKLAVEALGNEHGARASDEGEGYFQEFSLELLERDENTQTEILDALERLSNDRFGICEGCEAWIRKERLNAVPYARNCIDCQREAERNGAF